MRLDPTAVRPYTNAVIIQHFHSVDAPIGKEISTVRLHGTECRNHSCQYGPGAGAHIHGVGGEQDEAGLMVTLELIAPSEWPEP